MKKNVQKAISVAITVALGITLVMLIRGEGFLLFRTGLYAFVAFIIDYLFTYLFEVKKK